MKKRFLAAVLVGISLSFQAGQAQDFSQPGPWMSVASEVTVSRPDGSSFPALLFIPAEVVALDSSRALAPPPYPAVSFGHGFLCPPSLYTQTMQHLASWGYLVIATKSGLDLFPDHAQYAEDLRHCLTYLARENERAGSMLFGQVDTNSFGLSGHSMGGGAAMLAAAADSRVRAVASLAAAETRPSAIEAAGCLTIPVCLVAGSADAITPLNRHVQPMYDRLAGPRLRPVIRGGSHCGFVDVELPDFACDTALIPRERQLALSRRMLTVFFELYLRGRAEVWNSVWGPDQLYRAAYDTQADPNLSLTPPTLRQKGRPGEAVEFRLQLRNEDSRPAAFALEATGNTVALSLQPAVTETLAPCATVEVTARVAYPPDGRRPAAFTLLSARSLADGLTRDFAILSVQKMAPAR
jgi:predicted dienelactone hydrolase